jgi:predicted transcriptional regulator
MLPAGYRRSRIEIVADILRLGEASEVEMRHNANMSYFQLANYLSALLELKLVDKATIGEQLVTYKITEKGTRLLKEIDNMMEILGEEGTVDI